jgi:predicted  nucleic acid-binding Zn-ribbon protein
MAQLPGTTNSKRSRSLARRQSRILVGTALLFSALSSVVARPALPAEAEPTVGSGAAVSPEGQARAQSEARTTPLEELTETLDAARTRLEELSRLTKEMAAKKSAFDALGAQNRKLLAEVRALHADRHQLRDARDAAMTRTERLDTALQQATAISQALGEQLAAARQESSQLSSQREALAAQLESSKSAMARAEAEVASLHGELENSRKRLADAAEQRAQADAKLAALEDQSAEAGQQIAALEAQIAELEDQLKAKDAALETLASARKERDELQQRLAEIEGELKREEDENEQFSAELAAFRTAAKAATDLARQHLLAVEDKIRELNQATSAIQPPEPVASGEPKAQPASGGPTSDNLTDSSTPSAASAEGADDSKSSPIMGQAQADSYQLIPPAHAAEASSESTLQTILVDAMRKQREKLQGLVKELDDGRK